MPSTNSKGKYFQIRKWNNHFGYFTVEHFASLRPFTVVSLKLFLTSSATLSLKGIWYGMLPSYLGLFVLMTLFKSCWFEHSRLFKEVGIFMWFALYPGYTWARAQLNIWNYLSQIPLMTNGENRLLFLRNGYSRKFWINKNVFSSFWLDHVLPAMPWKL